MGAVDAGFDVQLEPDGDWLAFTAAGNLATVWLTEDESAVLVAVTPERLVSEVGTIYAVTPWNADLPTRAAFAWLASTRALASDLLRRINVLGQVLPDQVLHEYNAVIQAEIEKALAEPSLERTVEVRQRVGQDLYRKALMKYWNGACAITGITNPVFLRASHAKPWRDATDRERLDVHNGLLLAAHLDIAFDQGFIAVDDDGMVLVSDRLSHREREVLRLDVPRRIEGIRAEHMPYLAWHRDRLWQR